MTSQARGGSAKAGFHVVSVGWEFDMIDRLLMPVEKSTGIRFSHILHPSLDHRALRNRPDAGRFYCFREDVRMRMPQTDQAFLASLERAGIPTIHNMIMSDRVLRKVDYLEALGYATHIAKRLVGLFEALKPSVVLGAFDSFHEGIALAVARKHSIPFVAMNFSVIPSGYCSFCSALTPNSQIAIGVLSDGDLQAIASGALKAFEEKSIKAPAYISARRLSDVARRLPAHLRSAFLSTRNVILAHSDKFNSYSIAQLCKQYFRKRWNLITLPKDWLIREAPSTPFFFFGLHMQPESSIDVWAPFYSDQPHVIEMIARSMPPTHRLLVKIHKSDADNYSRRQLRQLLCLPGVRLVSPFVDSRPFIEKAALVLSIQGTIGLEAALLGKPVIMFGSSPVGRFPSVSVAGRVTDLPVLIAEKLRERMPLREDILRAFAQFLSPMCPASDNDWSREISTTALDGYSKLFHALRERLTEDEVIQPFEPRSLTDK
jgi:hypothetical protein